mgnify:CR=1 FL=1
MRFIQYLDDDGNQVMDQNGNPKRRVVETTVGRVLIAEVLSSSTESYDRGMKRKCDQEHLPGLQTYVLVAQDAVLVEVLRGPHTGGHRTCSRRWTR